MSRAILMLTLIAVSAVASPVVLRSGDPALDGKDHLISEQDFRAILVAARVRLATIRPRPSIYRVTVVSATEADAWYGNPNDIDSECLVVERSKKGWQVTRRGGIQRS